MTYNFGFWLGLFFIIFYFATTLGADEYPLTDKEKSSIWVTNPLLFSS